MAEDQDPLLVPVPVNEDQVGGSDMATANQELAAELIGQSMGALSGTAAVAQANFVTVNKALDFDFIEGKRMVTLPEAVGIREVASKQVPAGPTSAG